MNAALLDFFARVCPVPEGVDPAAMGPLPEPRGPLFSVWVPDPEFVEPPGAGFHDAPVAYRALVEPRWRRAKLFALAALPPPPPDLGRARPDKLRLDAELRPPAERERPPTLGDRAVRARTPPAAAARLRAARDARDWGRARPEKFRLDADFTLPPERIGPEPRREARRMGFPEVFWTQFVDPGRTLYHAPPFPEPAVGAWSDGLEKRVEAQSFGGNPEGLYPYDYEESSTIEDALDEVREQFFLRRDVDRVEVDEEELRMQLERDEQENPVLEKYALEIIPPVTFDEWEKLEVPLALAIPRGPIPSGESLALLRTLQQALAEDPPPRVPGK